MDDLERLYLLRELLIKSQLSTTGSLGDLANQIESILVSIEIPSDALSRAYSDLWGALEVVGVHHQEAQSEPTPAELADLDAMARRLKNETDVEIVVRSCWRGEGGTASDA